MAHARRDIRDQPTLVVTETVRPDGAMARWLSPDLRALGWRVVVLPSQEIVARVGVDAWRRLLVDVVRCERPQILLVHPPYDHISVREADAARRLGCRVVAFGFDDPIVLSRWDADGATSERLRALERVFDLYATTSAATVTRARAAGCRRFVHLRWAASPEPFASPAPRPDSPAPVLLVGRAYAKRVALVRALASLGVELHVYGHGWEGVFTTPPPGVQLGPPLSREVMAAEIGAAGLVVTTGDWEDAALPMTKFRLLETALCGGVQAAQSAPDLRDYFPADELPSWQSPVALTELIRDALAYPERARARAEAARRRALAEHRWTRRWPELLAALAAVDRPLRPARAHPARPSAALSSLLAAIAGDLEHHGDPAAALAFWEEAARSCPNDADPLLGAGRALLALGRPREAAARLRQTKERLAERPAASAPGLYLHLPTASSGRGLGLSGGLEPRVELEALLLTALLGAGEVAEAVALAESIDDDDVLVGLAAILDVQDSDASSPLWRVLLTRALAAHPRQQRSLADRHRARWTAALTAIAVAHA